jgi:hypothetical protein
VVARECTRPDVVAHLATDRSETVRRRALEHLVKLGAASRSEVTDRWQVCRQPARLMRSRTASAR